MTLYVDRYCELSSMIEPWAELYYRFDQLPIDPHSVYIVGREQMRLNTDRIRSMATQCRVVFSNPAEGSETMIWHLRRYGIEDLVLSGQVKLVGGGRMPLQYSQLLFEHFLTQPFRFQYNVESTRRTQEIFDKTVKPYKFLCLNGRGRPHRTALLNHLAPWLSQALWTNLDATTGAVHLLPPSYEVENYSTAVDAQGFVKPQLFNGEWGEIYIRPEPYIDSYFSVVTETVWATPHSFFTEKIAKPLAIGHPFVVLTNVGFLRDLRELGFRTFTGLIDESYDTIEDPNDRLQQVVAVIQDLCASDLGAFIQAAEPICKYNQQRLQEFAAEEMAQLPQRLFDFIQYAPDKNN